MHVISCDCHKPATSFFKMCYRGRSSKGDWEGILEQLVKVKGSFRSGLDAEVPHSERNSEEYKSKNNRANLYINLKIVCVYVKL